MISVLIPVYNSSIIPLVEELHKQLEASKTIYEIIVWDDGSSEAFYLQNKIINHVPNIHYFRSEKNYGRTKTRQLLYQKSVFNWLLYLDADVIPKSQEFIQNYLNLTSKGYDAVYGGCAYGNIPPKESMLLRWKYGRAKEEVDANIRNQKPYKIVVSGNFMIKRSVFSVINSKIVDSGYGFDMYFGALLKANQIKVFHINNEVYHLGVESSTQFLSKTKEAVNTLLNLYQNGKITSHDNSLLHLFISLKKSKLCGLFSTIYKKSHKRMERNLLGKNPSIARFQLYKISYMCFKYKNHNS
ncbi:MAG: glycosyltransferase family 2 protein [Gelidibacter sp.]